MTTQVVTVSAEGLTLSRVLWQFLKRQPEGYIEKVLDANPGLAGAGYFLPVGTVVIFPLDDIPAAQKERPLIRLWD